MSYLAKTISLELKKTKRRGIWLVLALFLLSDNRLAELQHE